MMPPSTEERSLDARVVLGRTGLRVGRLALAAGYGIGPEGIELALERGQNLFYWGSLRRRAFGNELQRQIRKGRERLVIAVQSYARSAWMLVRSVESARKRLGTDGVEILILGFWQSPLPDRLIEAALGLQQRGWVKHLCVSTHDVRTADRLASASWVDLLMIRYNAAHREIESVLDKMPAENRPGILAFTATRWGDLLDPRRVAHGEAALTAGECYRFCLAHSKVDAVMCGAANMAQWHEALGVLGTYPPSKDELTRMKSVGDRLRARKSIFYDFGTGGEGAKA